MKTILVPTDFSTNAETALNCAIDLAKKNNSKILLLHAYQINYATSYVPFSTIAEETLEAKKESAIQLKILEEKMGQAGLSTFESMSMEEYAVEAVLKIIKEMKVDLVVMGTKGASGLSGVLFGSNTAKVIEKATCPVIAVPEGASFKKLKRITYATTYKYSDIKALKIILDIARPFNAQINVLHVSGNAESDAHEKEKMTRFMKDLKKEFDYNNLSFQILNGENVEETLEEYVMEDSSDLLVMSTHQRDLFDKIFGTSITRQMAYHTKVPLMALHHNSIPAARIY